MRFDARELKPYAEPVSPQDLEETKIYYAVNYMDSDMVVPVIDTVVFIGRNLENGDTDVVYFQDVDSYQRGIRYASAKAEALGVFHAMAGSQANHIFDFEHALEQLMACSLRRRGVGP